ncbi:MAG: hypothetical protein JWN20_919 [Jatrophihabitantaceae bacterium]|nr:hypothetical protein [Jatrophihabitantaceae bacterium]
MTYQPPPPPPGSPYPAGPPGPGGGPAFDPKTVNPLDWGIIAAGVLTLIFSFFPYYKASYSGFGVTQSASFNGWHGLTWLGTILAFAAAALLAVELFKPGTVKLPIPTRLAVLGAFAIAFLTILLGLVWVPVDTGGIDGIDKGHGIGYWLSALAVIAGLVLSVLRLKATGGSLPWENRPAASGAPGAYPPPVQGGYAPPAPPVQGDYAPPVQGGYAPPVQGGYAPPPAPPVQGGYPPPPPPPGSYPPPPAN